MMMRGGRDMKKLLVGCLSLFLMFCVFDGKSRVKAADKYPAKPISLIVPLDAGGGMDVPIRRYCEKLGALLGQPVVVVNKPGAGSSIGYRAMHDAKPDGYTLGAAMTTLVANKLQGLLPYDYHDYTVLGTIQAPTPVFVASTKSKRTFKTFKEVIEFARSHPEEISMAAGGKGQGWWNLAKDIETVTGARFNLVPQVGSGASSIAQVAGGHVEVGIVGLPEANPQVEVGNTILLAIAIPGTRRLALYPHVPCVNEFGYGSVRYYSTTFFVGPLNMPKEITDILVKAVEGAAKDPDYKKYVEEQLRSAFVIYLPPDQTMKQLDEQRGLLRDIFDKAGLLKEK
jgi:tripartite-type tricarboxylate transporter receptor subunit TctC